MLYFSLLSCCLLCCAVACYAAMLYASHAFAYPPGVLLLSCAMLLLVCDMMLLTMLCVACWALCCAAVIRGSVLLLAGCALSVPCIFFSPAPKGSSLFLLYKASSLLYISLIFEPLRRYEKFRLVHKHCPTRKKTSTIWLKLWRIEKSDVLR